ncbi:MAG: response regulator, partial [Candidatus Omnitrophica bacterium]|nr:response regulator [Candidatus Omnitrophota bacterium]
MAKKILVVDDEADFLKLLRLNLEAEDYIVITALDGEEALSKLKSEKPDAVILDIMLPKLNGEEVCRCIRSDLSLSATPVIMLTGKDSDTDRIVSRVIGADIYITK